MFYVFNNNSKVHVFIGDPWRPMFWFWDFETFCKNMRGLIFMTTPCYCRYPSYTFVANQHSYKIVCLTYRYFWSTCDTLRNHGNLGVIVSTKNCKSSLYAKCPLGTLFVSKKKNSTHSHFVSRKKVLETFRNFLRDFWDIMRLLENLRCFMSSMTALSTMCSFVTLETQNSLRSVAKK
jgi:hypothetical protein